MNVKIAGYNIDKSLIDSLPNKKIATPETISAAYARISRSKKSVTELREEALEEVDKARSSNDTIIFEMGHSSVAEHAVFNFDLIGISRYLVETIQKTRLASFTEKSQRYVTLDGDYVTPKELVGTPLEALFESTIAMQNNLYELLYKKGKKYLEASGFEGAKRELQGRAKEDARYMLALATETQMGMTINARSIAKLLRRLDAMDLEEAKDLKQEIETQVKEIAPSLIRYTTADEYEKSFLKAIPSLKENDNYNQINLVKATPNGDDEIIKALAFEKYGYPADHLNNWVEELDIQTKEQIFTDLFANMKSFHSAPRAFEVVDFTFELSMSSCCFGQLKRHRMSTILRSSYNPNYGYVIPSLIKKIGVDSEIKIVLKAVEELYEKMEALKKGLGNYILTNAHRLNVIFKANLREMYHFSRLRSDIHAQWEIREISNQLEKMIKEQVPLAAKVMMGKDEFNAL